MNEIISYEDFTKRLIQLLEDLGMEEDDEININDIKADLINHNDTWIRDWLNDIKLDIKSKIHKEDPDYIGHCLVECDKLLDYLEISK